MSRKGLLEDIGAARKSAIELEREIGGSRALSLSKTRLEEAEMWAKVHVRDSEDQEEEPTG